jgi:hypothetical protein
VKIILKYCGLAALLAGAALYFSNCDGGPTGPEPVKSVWEWVPTPKCLAPVKDIYFVRANDGWAFGGSYALRWDGEKWYRTEWPSSATTDVWFNSPDDGWRTTPAYIHHWDGVSWARVAECGPFEGFASIAFNEPDSGWSGLYADWPGYPQMFHYDGYKWDYYPDGFTQDVWDIDFSSTDYGCAVGIEASIFKNGEWVPTADPKCVFWCVECVGPDDIWAGSDSGDIYHFTGFG